MAKGKGKGKGRGKGKVKAKKASRASSSPKRATRAKKGSKAKSKAKPKTKKKATPQTKSKAKATVRSSSRSKAKGTGPGPELTHEPEEEEEVFDPPKGDRWTSPVSYDAKSFSTLFRRSLDELGFKYRRKQADKMYTQTMVLFPLPKAAYVYRFEISWPMEVWIDLYDTKPSHAGIIPYMDIHGVTPKKLDAIRDLLEHIIEKLPRPPWQFTIGQRLQHGLLIPEWSRAKKAWRKLGFKLEKWKTMER